MLSLCRLALARPLSALARASVHQPLPALPAPRLLAPPPAPGLLPSAGIMHRAELRKRCKHCYFVVKDEQRFVLCTAKPRHYTAQKLTATKYGNMIMTHATQGGNRHGTGRGTRHIKTQQSFRLEY
jgi:ribosomal protein L36